ncbi:hypothetical protein D3C75_801460 [compost metagenome]
MGGQGSKGIIAFIVLRHHNAGQLQLVDLFGLLRRNFASAGLNPFDHGAFGDHIQHRLLGDLQDLGQLAGRILGILDLGRNRHNGGCGYIIRQLDAVSVPYLPPFGLKRNIAAPGFLRFLRQVRPHPQLHICQTDDQGGEQDCSPQHGIP